MTVESVFAQSPQQEAVDAIGLQHGRSYFSPEPFEHYDTVSGNVVLTFADLTLPGNAGRSLTFQRTYNNLRKEQPSRWSFGIAGVVMRVHEKPVPPNYNFNDDAEAIIATTPDFEMADGSLHHTMYVTRPNPATAETMEVRSSDFLVYDRQYHFLKMPNGTVCYYDPPTGRLISVHDQYGDVLSLSWSSESVVVTQHLGNGQDRVVTLSIDAQARVTGMQYDGRVWSYQYGHDSNGVLDITEVTLPEGLRWTFTYDASDLRSIRTPNGGLISYEYETDVITDPTNTYPDLILHSLISRHSEGRDVQTGDWIIDWLGEAGSSFSWSTHIQTPSGTRVVYEHGLKVISEEISRVVGGNFGVRKQSVFDGSLRIQFEEFKYQAVSFVQYTSPYVWWGTPELDEHKIERDGRTYITRLVFDANNFGDYHQPKEIIEDGDLTRRYDAHLPPLHVADVRGWAASERTRADQRGNTDHHQLDTRPRNWLHQLFDDGWHHHVV